MKIIFDFDCTLFDTREFKLSFQKAFEGLGVNEKLFFKTYNDSKMGQVYDPKVHFKLIENSKPEIPIGKMEKTLNKLLKESPKFLYPDTVPFLEKWQNKAELILLSFAKEQFQKEKIKKSSIEKFFREIFITQDINKTVLLNKILGPEKRAIFVNDDFQTLSEIKKSFPKVITVRVDRGEKKYRREPDNSQIDFSIKNLKELEKLMFVTR